MDACVERLRHGDVSAVGDLVTYALLPRVFPEGVVGRQLYTLLTQLLVREGRRLQLLTRATRAASLPSEHYLPLGAALSGHSDSKASLSSLPSSGSSNSGSSGGSGGSVAAGVASNNNSNKNRNNSGHGEGASNGVCGGNALACAQATTSAASRAAVALPLPSADAFDALRVLAIVGARRGGDGAAVREVLHSIGVSHCRRMSLDAYFACTDRTRLYMTVRFVQLLMRTLPCAAHELLSVAAHVQLLTNGTRTTRPSSLPQQQQQLPPQPPPPHALLTQPAPSSSLSLPQPWPPPSSVSLATLQTRSPPALAMMAATASSSSSAEPMLVSIHSTASNEQARMASTYTYHHSAQQQAQQAQNNGNNRYNSNGSCSREHSTASAATTATTTQQPQLTSVTTTPLPLAAAAGGGNGASVYINGTLHDAELTLYPGRRYRELPARPQHAPPAQNPLYVAPRKQSSNSRSSGGDGGGGESVQWLRPQLPPPVIAFVCYYGLGCVPVLPRLGDISATHDVTQPPPQTRNDSTSMTTAASNNSSSSGGAGSSAVQALQLSLPCAAPPQRPYTVRPRTLPATTMTTISTTTQAMPTASSINVQATTTTATDATARDRAATAAAARTATTASPPPSSTTTTTTTTTMPQVHSTAVATAQQGDSTPALLRSYLYDGDVYSWGCDCYSALGTTTAAATSRPVSSSTSSTTTTTTTTTTVSSSSPSPHTPSRSTSIATTTPPLAHAAASTPCVPVTIGTGNDADALTPQLPLLLSLSYEHFALTPSRVRLPATLTTVVHVVCGYSVTYLVSGDGALYGCGRSERGQLGMSAAASREHAHSGVRALQRIALRGDEHVVCVACGGASAVALTREGRLQMWGDNTCGQCLRSEATACVYGLPEQYKAHAHAAVTEVACGVRFGLVTFANGVLGVWGLPPCGVGGTAAATTAAAATQSTTHKRTPTKASASISNGHRRTPVVCLRKIRALPPPAAAPAADASSSSASSLRDAYAHVFAGPWHAVAVSRCGVVYTWGRGARGRLGHGDTSDEAQPRVVAALRAFVVTAAACGEAHTLLLTHTGAVYACGDDAHGQLGLATVAATATNASNKRSSNGDGDGGATAVVDDATMCTTPTLVALPAPALAVACGAWHTCVLLCDGDVLVCGAARTSGVGLGRGTCTRALVHAHPSLCALSLSSGLYHSSVLALRRRTRLTLLGTSRYASELSRIDEARESSNNSKDKDKDDVSMRRTVQHANNNNSGSGSTTRSNSNETEADKPPRRSRRGRRSSSNNNNNGGGGSARRRGRGTRGTSLSAVRDVALGEGFAIVLRDDGVAVGIGLCDRGQLGLGDGVQPRSGDEVAVALSAYERVRMPAAALPLQSVCCGPHFVLALDAGGRVYGWGSNTCGVLCTRAPATTTATNGKQQQEHDDDDDEGGEGSCGALGTPSIVYTPTLLRGYDGRCVVQIACGGSFVVALDDGGVVLTHGERAYCGLGHDAGTTTAMTATVHASPRHSRAARTTTPMPSTTATTPTAATVAATAAVVCVYAPTVVRALPPRVISVAAGRQHAVALTADGGIFAWGCGVLGVDGSTASVVPPPPRESSSSSSSSNGAAVVVAAAATAAVVSVPTRVAFAQPVRRLGCGVSNTYVVTSDGDLYVWGDNSAHQCGVAAATAVSAAAVHGSPRHGHSHKAVTATSSSSGDDAAGVVVVVPWPTRVAQRVRDVAFTRHCCVVVHDDGRVRVAGALQHRGRAYVLDTFDATPQPPLSWPASDAKPTTTTTTRATAAADALPMLLAAARRDGDAHAATAPHVQGDSVAADDDDNGSSVVATSTACVRCFAGWDSVVVVEQELARPSCGDVTRAVDKLRSLTRAA